MRALVLSSIITLVVACGAAERSAGRTLRVQARDEDGQPLAGLAVEIDGVFATRTSDSGGARISLSADGAPRARVAVRCGDGQREVPARQVQRTCAEASAPLELSFLCRPRVRTLAVVVRAPGGQGLLVRADGEPLGRIEADGTLHGILSRAPDAELRLSIDTGELPLTPREPVHVVQIPDRDELVVFDQPFNRRPVRSIARARVNAPAARSASETPVCHEYVERSPEPLPRSPESDAR